MIKFDSQLKTFHSDKINDSSFFSGFGTRSLGDGAKIDTLTQFFSILNLKFTKIVILEQIHSSNAVFFTGKDSQKFQKIEDTDGVVTKDFNTVLFVKTADCLPIMFVEKKAGLIGISHQGWRGSIKRLAQKMVSEMVNQGADPANITVAIGPGIGPCCYDIDDDRYYQFLEEFDGYSAQIFRLHGGKRYVDLAHLNYLLLTESGIKKENIDFFPFCTKCDQNRFFSFRRDKKEVFAEMFHFIIKKDEQKLFDEYI